MFGSELQRGEIIIITDEAKGWRWRRRDSCELFNLSDHIVTCSISGRRKSFHLCRRKGERGSISINRQTTPWQAIYYRAGASQANERQEKFSFRSDRILQSSCCINHVWGAWHAHIMACCEVRRGPPLLVSSVAAWDRVYSKPGQTLARAKARARSVIPAARFNPIRSSMRTLK